MKRILLVLLTVLSFVACSKEDENPIYTKEQEAVLKVLNGQFYSKSSNNEQEKITFLKQFEKPVTYKISPVYGKNLKLDMYGELLQTLHSDSSDISLKKAYNIREDGKFISIFIIERDSTLGVNEIHKINIKNNDEFDLYNISDEIPNVRTFLRISY